MASPLQTDISAHSLPSSGAMAMLCTDINSNCICLIGWWWLDEMFHYLHTWAFPITCSIALLMLQKGTFTLIPNTAHAAFVQALL